MKVKKLPLRKCLGCGESRPKKELIRIVKNKDEEIFVDLIGKANGRGAYICNNRECFDNAKKTKRLNKALEANIDETIYSKLLEEVEKNE